jgi:hypothetical protein
MILDRTDYADIRELVRPLADEMAAKEDARERATRKAEAATTRPPKPEAA